MDTIDGIALIYSEQTEKDWYRSFLHGIEEEGVPVRCIDAYKEECVQSYDAVEMAKVASRYSIFEIGVGIDHSHLAVRHRLQKDAAPLLEADRGDGEERIRLQGHNVARIIKKTPLFLGHDCL